MVPQLLSTLGGAALRCVQHFLLCSPLWLSPRSQHYTRLNLHSILAPFPSLSHFTSLFVLTGIPSQMTTCSHIFYLGSTMGRTQPKIFPL